MSSVGSMIVVVLPLLAVFLAIPIWIGVYVYHDAKRRGMNAVLWTVIAVVAPSLIGFIIYLLMRGNYPDLACANCGERVTEQFVVCPGCGVKLRASCPGCAFPVEAGWAVCPRCASPLPERQDDIVAPMRHADKTLWKILVAVIAVPILLILLLLAALGQYSGSGAGVAGMMELTIEDYFEEQAPPRAKEEVQAWLDGLMPAEEQAYVLCYSHTGGPLNEFYYLVYVPGAGNSANKGLGMSGSLFGKVLNVDLERTGDAGSLLCISATSEKEKPPKLKIKVDGEKIPCEITTVDFEPTGMQ